MVRASRRAKNPTRMISVDICIVRLLHLQRAMITRDVIERMGSLVGDDGIHACAALSTAGAGAEQAGASTWPAQPMDRSSRGLLQARGEDPAMQRKKAEYDVAAS